MAHITEILPDNVPSFSDELLRFFEQAAAAGMHEPSLRAQHLLRLEDAVRWTQSVHGHPIVDALGGLVLDDIETSNHHFYVGAGPLKGAVFFLCHDGDSRIVYASLSEFLLAAIRAKNEGQWLEEQHPPRSPVAADQAGLSKWMRHLLTLDNRDELVPPFVPSLDLSDSLLLRDLAGDEDFFIAESVALEIRARPTLQLTEIAELCAKHRHPQASKAGSMALAAIQALQV
ncbi:hypothetical protein [Ralstonia mojiangensis]|uniref:hypothetical protein n=1 Tax=Ralstonia mojiangensis TaxID=2953895 RepID=UPI00209036FA|nr:hypothetical protein [Ralstonia mojiangensis]MCO5411874.1 hypothetical protein [Ralstonia mojiangensis]